MNDEITSKPPATGKKDHHFVPQMYLRVFADPASKQGELWRYGPGFTPQSKAPRALHRVSRGLRERLSTRGAGGIGLSRDGGMAEYVVAPARQLLSIGELDVAQAAPLTDAGLTPYHAINITRRGLSPGSTCVVIGVGGLGHMAVQILAATTASRIIAIDARDEALQLARDVGAHQAFPSDADTAGRIRELVGPAPGGADVVLDCVGAPATVEIARAVVSTGGDVAIVGLAGGALPVGFGTLPLEVRVVVPFWGTKSELAEVLALAQAGRITAHVQRFSLSEAGAAYEKLRSGQVQGRAVIVPGA